MTEVIYYCRIVRKPILTSGTSSCLISWLKSIILVHPFFDVVIATFGILSRL